MSAYNYVSGQHVVIFVTLVCTLYLKYDCISGLEFAPKLTEITMLYHL